MSTTLERLTASLADRYRVDRELGAGGMATVYLAHDLRHERDVAIKVLHPDLGAALGAERFLSEIKTTAKLQHPHILPLLDSGAADGLLYYVMPYVRGETLRGRLEREKQLPIADAVRIAREVAGALDHAHKQGIIHRDIKPENILLQDGSALVADFGIALAVQQAGTQRLTQTGLSLGTPQYMSPEQAMGEKSVDLRSDIYALGAVTYEMLAGEPPFTGATTQVIVAKVLSERPVSLRAIRDSVSEAIDEAVGTALSKTPADRFANAPAFVDALTHAGATRAAPLVSQPRRSKASLLAVGLALVAAVVFAVLWWRDRAAPAGEEAVVRMVLEQEPGEGLPYIIAKVLSISPDGSTIAYSATSGSGRRLMVRHLDQIGAIPAPENGGSPMFSPDGTQMVVRRDENLYVGPVRGGAFTRIPGDVLRGVPVSGNMAGVWIDNRRVLLAGDSILRVLNVADGSWKSVASGLAEPLRSPIAIPGQSAAIATQSDRTRNVMALVRLDVETGAIAPLGVDGLMALGLVDGALVYATIEGELMVVALDAKATKATGTPKRVGGGVLTIPGPSGIAYAALSANGHLIYEDQSALSQLVRVTSAGSVVRLLPDTQAFSFPRFSPDARRIALDIADPRSHRKAVWVLDLATNILTRVTDAANDTDRDRAEWSADGRRVIYRVADGRQIRVAMRSVDQAEPEQLIGAGVGSFNETMMAADGRTLVGRVNSGMRPPTGVSDQQAYTWLLGDSTKRPITQSALTVSGPRLSPDGRWLAYSEGREDGYQVYVAPFPGPGPRVRVNRGAGGNPVWRRDSKALYYPEGDAIVEVSLAFTPDPVITGTRAVTQGVLASDDRLHAAFDVGPNGDIIGIRRVREPRLIVVRNFATEVRLALRGNGS
jgi:serine/threonine-protein kinase